MSTKPAKTKQKKHPQPLDDGLSHAPDCSLSMTVYSGPMGGGAKRLAALVGRHVKSGLLPKSAWQCPECGGPLQIDDAGGIVKNDYRYAIGCKNLDCQSVIANSVKAVLAIWADICRANDERIRAGKEHE